MVKKVRVSQETKDTQTCTLERQRIGTRNELIQINRLSVLGTKVSGKCPGLRTSKVEELVREKLKIRKAHRDDESSLEMIE